MERRVRGRGRAMEQRREIVEVGDDDRRRKERLPEITTVFIPGSSLKVLRHIHMKKVLDYYASIPQKNPLSSLSMRDLSKKWRYDTRKDKQLSAEIMKIAPSIVSVSTFYGVERMVDCSGFVIDWDATTSEATILTSAKILRIPKNDVWDNYYVLVRLANGKILEVVKEFVDYYHNFVTLKVKSEVELKAARNWLSDMEGFSEGMDVIALGRDFFSFDFVEMGGVLHMNYPFFGSDELLSSTCDIREFCEGGPLMTKSGYVCGIIFCNGYACPLPTPVIHSCLETWRSHGIVVRPWFGMTVIDTDELSHDALQKLGLSSEVKGAVIKQVCEESPAGQLGVCPGDFVICCNGFDIYSARQYSQVLSHISADLSSHYACEASDHARKTTVLVQRSRDDNHYAIEVNAQSVAVNDRRFCFCWPQNESIWDGAPRSGSQVGFPYDIALYNKGEVFGYRIAVPAEE